MDIRARLYIGFSNGRRGRLENNMYSIKPLLFKKICEHMYVYIWVYAH